MDYTNISALLQWAETPDTSGGLFLQPEELATVDAALGTVTVLTGKKAKWKIRATENKTQLDALTAQVQTLTGQVSSLTTERDALQVQVDALGKKPSGSGSTLKPAGPGAIQADNVPFHDDPSHPWNIAADRATAMAKAKAKRRAEEDQD